MKNLNSLKHWTFSVFTSLTPMKGPFKICFSGGKDSHALLALYLEWSKLSGKSLNIVVVFSDTYLETPSLYDLVSAVQDVCGDKGLPFVKVQPPPNRNYWVVQFGLGYPVPYFANRWCTGYLKVDPMDEITGIYISGAHEGESIERDNRLRSCGSSECGLDILKGGIEPIARWSNCAVWDYLLLYGDQYLYKGAYQALADTYAAQGEDDIDFRSGGKLRMGCFHCPVITEASLSKKVSLGILPSISKDVRRILEDLRVSPRLKSPRTLKNGALWVDARIKYWSDLSPLFPELLARGWIDKETINLVNKLLEKRTYPPTYPIEWIKAQENLILDNIKGVK